MNAISAPPAPLVRPKLAVYMFEREITLRMAGEALDQSPDWVRLVCLPFDDPRRRVPNKEAMERIVAWTGGEIAPADFYPDHLNQGGEAASLTSPLADTASADPAETSEAPRC
jgi:hypothetical protein